MQPIRIFVSYSYTSKKWVDDDKQGLIKWLRRAFEEFEIPVDWRYEHNLIPGDHFAAKIVNEIAFADIVILMLNTHCITPGYIADKEIPAIRKRHEEEKTAVIPILINTKHIVTSIRRITELKVFPSMTTTLMEIVNDDAAWAQTRDDIGKEILDRIEEINTRRAPGLP